MTLVFPSLPGLDIGIKRSIITSTSVQTAVSGKELRAQWWSSPKYEWELTFNFLRQAGYSKLTVLDEVTTLGAFFQSVSGQYQMFYFTDSLWNSVTNQTLATGNGVTYLFQLVDPYGVSVVNNGSPSIYINGVLQTSGFSLINGQLNFSLPVASGAVLTWSGSYYYKVRFDTDALDLKQLASLLYSSESLKLISVK